MKPNRGTRMRRVITARRTGRLSIAAAGLLAASCVQTTEVRQQPTIRSSVETAPADLQLACAAEVAITQGLSSDRVLPVSSSAGTPGTYLVVVDAGGRQVNCSIDSEGNVLSLG